MKKPSLNNAYLKLEWADKHLNAFKQLANDFVQGHPYETRIQGDGANRKLLVRLTSPIPPQLSLIAGDVLNNARTALEYTAVELAVLKVGRIARSRNFTTFPIHDRRKTFKDAETRHKAKFRGRDWAVIRRLQPYRRIFPENVILLRLQELNNRDKHRQLNFVIPVIKMTVGPSPSVQVAHDRPLRTDHFTEIPFPVMARDPVSFAIPAVFFTTPLSTGRSSAVTYPPIPIVNMDTTSEFLVRFDPSIRGSANQPVIPVLREIIGKVKKTIEEFGR